MTTKESIASALQYIKSKIKDTQLVAVSKYSPIEDVLLAYECGQIDFGENRVKDLEEKSKNLVGHPGIRWHFIGHLQSNKVKNLLQIPQLVSIQSIDSLKLCQEIVKRKSYFNGVHLDLYFQMNTSKETQKSGFQDYPSLIESLEYAQEHLFDEVFRFKGLMTIGSIRTEDFEADAKRCFSLMNSYKEKLKKDFGYDVKLSMGMSQDYPIAVEMGSDLIRVGSLIFKEN